MLTRLARLAFFMLCCSATLAVAAPPQITSITPSAAAVGSSIVLTGGPFDATVRIILGEKTIAPEEWSATRLRFTVPELPAGEYVLILRHGTVEFGQRHTLRLTLPPPVITGLEPQRFDRCNVSGASLHVSGHNFVPGAALLLDGAALPIGSLAPSRIDLALPPLNNGLHQLEVLNPDGSRSLPHALFVDGTPTISSVTLGEDRLVNYELLIDGHNFAPQMTLLVNGSAIPSLSASDPNIAAPPVSNPPRSDYWYYVDCGRIVFVRHPFSRDPRSFNLHVSAPGGGQSAPYTIITP